MIHIVSGKMNSGKSTTLGEIYRTIQDGDGYISIKRMHYDKVHGYEVMKLSDNTFFPLVIREEFAHESMKIACQIGPYKFLKDTLTHIEQDITRMIEDKVSPIFLDEVGQLELYDQCFHSIFQMMVESGLELYVTVREDLVQKVIEKYKMKEVDIITV